MGYDMYRAAPPTPEEQQTKAVNQARFNALVKARDLFDHGDPAAAKIQGLVHDAYCARNDADPTYFRLNVFGMGVAFEHLEHLGIATWVDKIDLGEWPKAEGSHVDEGWHQDGHGPEAPWYGPDGDVVPADQVPPELRAHAAEVDAYVSWTPPGFVGIPGWKIYSTNDGWHVLPDDIRSGIAAADEQDPDWRDHLRVSDVPSYVLEFIEWMEQCADGGGFYVH